MRKSCREGEVGRVGAAVLTLVLGLGGLRTTYVGFPHSWSRLPLALIRTWPLQFVVTSITCSDISLMEGIHTQGLNDRVTWFIGPWLHFQEPVEASEGSWNVWNSSLMEWG